MAGAHLSLVISLVDTDSVAGKQRLRRVDGTKSAGMVQRRVARAVAVRQVEELMLSQGLHDVCVVILGGQDERRHTLGVDAVGVDARAGEEETDEVGEAAGAGPRERSKHVRLAVGGPLAFVVEVHAALDEARHHGQVDRVAGVEERAGPGHGGVRREGPHAADVARLDEQRGERVSVLVDLVQVRDEHEFLRWGEMG